MSKIIDFDQLYPNRFLKAGELAGKDKEATVTIAAVDLEELEGEKGKKARGVITFKETTKQWVLNRTNGECLKAMFGREVPKWIGKRVTIAAREINTGFSDEPQLAIRVKGSPDIDGDRVFSGRIGRKQANIKLVRTGGRAGAVAAVPAEPAPATSVPDAAEQAAIIADEKAGAA